MVFAFVPRGPHLQIRVAPAVRLLRRYDDRQERVAFARADDRAGYFQAVEHSQSFRAVCRLVVAVDDADGEQRRVKIPRREFSAHGVEHIFKTGVEAFEGEILFRFRIERAAVPNDAQASRRRIAVRPIFRDARNAGVFQNALFELLLLAGFFNEKIPREERAECCND